VSYRNAIYERFGVGRMKVDVHNVAGEKIDTIELPPEIFEVPVNVGLMHQAFLRQIKHISDTHHGPR